MITSADNPKVKWMQDLQEARGRRDAGCYLVEGAILLNDALQSGETPRLVIYDRTALQANRRGRQLLERLAGLPVEEASAAVLRTLSDTVTPQGVVAAVPLPQAIPELKGGALAVVLDGLRDPGNAGTILRSAEAAACAAVVTTPNSVDLFSPKVVRAGMGAHFRLPLATDVDWPHLADMLRGRALYLAETGGEIAYYDVDWTKPAALVVGNETEGVRPEARRSAAGRVSIPMPGRAESLNAGVAASIVIFESVRQTLSLHKGA